MDHIPRVSEALYMGVCREIGTPTEVTFRRDLEDTEDMIRKPSELYEGGRIMLSGSTREGFMFKSSDSDYMFWFTDHKVICEMPQSTFYHPPRHTLIYMETSDTPPGFARLQLLTPSYREMVVDSLLEKNNTVYISSSLLRMRNHRFWMNETNPVIEGKNLHGPCHNYTCLTFEFDIALCFHSRHWPLPALPWVHRCRTRAWPSSSVLQLIIDEGFHLVPIAHKQTNELNSDLEWRISFSQAEQKLVYSMNHCQFLCYGVMKIILKEVICDVLLCSYFMKTILFWRIQESSTPPWIPSTLLQHVWFCFKSLMQCVHTGYLPNFFIPENNMFAGKVVGAQQMILYQKLETFYKMGVAFLLHSPTLREILIPALSDPYFVMQTGESYLKSEIDIDIEFHNKIYSLRGVTESDVLSNMMHLNVIDQIFSTCHNIVINNALIDTLISSSMSLKEEGLFVSRKKRYVIDRTIIHMLDLVLKLGCVSDGLYLAFYLYDNGRYQTALTVTERVKQRLSQPHIMYNYRVDRQRYSEAVGGQSMLSKFWKAWARDIAFDKKFTCIEELRLEQEVSKMNGMPALYLSPFVAEGMLSVLCHYRLGNRSQYLQALTDLHTLLLYDDGRYVPFLYRDLSWQILGICQQAVGDLHGALQSYQESLRQIPLLRIQTATESRIYFVTKQFE